MITHIRRYVFLDFETLSKIQFRKLEKVCDKVFVFISANTQSIPFSLVKEMQKMGNSVKWVEIGESSENDTNYHICFLMGKLHEKISGDVEFAILSNDASFDPLVNFINSTGRSCIRVRQQGISENTENRSPLSTPPFLNVETQPDAKRQTINASIYGERGAEMQPVGESSSTQGQFIEENARETVRRLIRSGSRPSDVNLLRSYILLHNQELSQYGNVDKIINKLTETKEIEVQSGIVTYNF